MNNIKKIGWSIIPRRCNCGCGHLYFSPMWRVLVGRYATHATGYPELQYTVNKYEYYSVKEYPKISDIPSTDLSIGHEAWVKATYLLTEPDWEVIRSHLTKEEFLDLNYNLHIYPLTIRDGISGGSDLRCVTICVQEIPDVIATGSNYDVAMDRLKKKLGDWYDFHSPDKIPRPQPYDRTFSLRNAAKK